MRSSMVELRRQASGLVVELKLAASPSSLVELELWLTARPKLMVELGLVARLELTG